MQATKLNPEHSRTPIFQRESFLRSPDWRWQQAMQITAAWQTGIALPTPTDKLVHYCVRIQKAALHPASRLFLQHKLPDAWHVYRLGTMDTSSQLRCDIQACLLDGLSPQEVAKELQWLTPLQAKLYRDLFMDIAGIQAVHGWIQQMLMQPAQHGQSPALFRTRVITYHNGRTAGRSAYKFGTSSHDSQQIMRKMWDVQKGKRIFGYMASKLNVPVQIYAPLMQSAIKSFQDKEYARELRSQVSQENQSLMDLADGIQAGVRHFTSAELQAQSDGTRRGQDSSNKFLPGIINKERIKK